MKTLAYLFLLFVVAFTVCCKKDLPGADPNTGPDPDPNPVVKSSDKRITANPVIPGLEKVAVVVYDAATFTYNITVPSDVNIKSLRLHIAVSAKATISPSPTTFLDYTKPISFTVTAEDGSTQVYIISITNVKDDIPTGPFCLVQRIENIATGEYFRFSYDSNGRVTEVVEAVIYEAGNHSASVTEWKKMTCSYGSNGQITECIVKSATPFNNWKDIVYRFSYSNKKLTTINIKDGSYAPISEAVVVNSNDQLIQWNSRDDRKSYKNDYTCYSFTYSNGSIIKTTYCDGNTVMAMTYGSVRHFLSAQAKHPALLFVFRDFAVQFDKTRLIPFHYGYFMPTELDLPSRTGCTATYTVNRNGFPTTMDIDFWWNLGTAFPEKTSFRYAVTYTNCQ